MVAQLQRKAGAERIDVTVGDFTNTRLPATFTLAYLVFNTIMNLTTQAAQVACFANVAEHLVPGGYFVIEVAVPDLRRLPPGETVRPFTVTPTRLGVSTSTTSPPRAWCRTTTRWRTTDSRVGRSPSDTCGPPNSTSWPNSPE